MVCPKCQGFMYQERFSDFFQSFNAWTCVNCGELIDKTILTNRTNSRVGLQFSRAFWLEQEKERAA